MSLDLLKKNIEEKDIKMFYFTGSWCPMCRTAMPKTLDIFNKIDLDQDRVEMIEVDSFKQEPADLLQDHKIFFVPTIVMYSGDKELGRITERPIKSWEEDLIEISTF